MARNANRQAAAAERKAADGKKTQEQKILEALQSERAGYVQRGPKYAGRVKQVDAQIKAYGGEPPKGQTAAEKKAADDAAKAEADAKAAAEKEAADKAAADAEAAEKAEAEKTATATTAAKGK